MVKTILNLVNLQLVLVNVIDHLFTDNVMKMMLSNYFVLNMVYKKHLDIVKEIRDLLDLINNLIMNIIGFNNFDQIFQIQNIGNFNYLVEDYSFSNNNYYSVKLCLIIKRNSCQYC